TSNWRSAMNPSPEGRLYDISRPLSATTACWPGDVPFAFRLGWCIRDGASVNVGSVETTVHTGTHCDAPFHYNDDGPTVERLPLAGNRPVLPLRAVRPASDDRRCRRFPAAGLAPPLHGEQRRQRVGHLDDGSAKYRMARKCGSCSGKVERSV